MTQYTVFPDGDIERYVIGDETIEGVLVVDSFAKAKKAAVANCHILIEKIESRIKKIMSSKATNV